MNAIELVKKLGSKLLGKKVNAPAVGEHAGGLATVTQIAPEHQVFLVLDGLGVIQLPEHWRN